MKQWKVADKLEKKENLVDLLLSSRGLATKKEKTEFLNPSPISEYIKKLPIDFKRSLKKSRDLIRKSIDNEVPIVIHGDYDADGICATAILFNTLKFELEYEHTFAFIPNRFEHGYGMTKKSIDVAVEKVAEYYDEEPEEVLFITVDSGITSVEEIEYLKSKGFKVIITDHHQKPKKLPQANVILWSDEVVGSTVSWILSRALGSKDPKSLGLAAIATVTDLQPLVGFNRSVVKQGLKILNSGPPVGIKKLIDTAGRKKSVITTYDLGWVIGPRLNASGRLVDASDSLLLLVEKDEEVVEDIVYKLNKANSERQDKTFEMYEIAKDIDSENLPKIIISHDENYHEGIIGLVAAKLVQTYYRPAVVISTGKDVGKGSVRSISGVDIISVLREFDDLFESLGGHPMAAGFGIAVKKIPQLEKALVDYFDKNVDEEVFEQVLKIDLEIPLELVDLDLISSIEQLQPFGIGNPEPKFLTRNLKVVGTNWVGKENQHLSLRISNGKSVLKAIWFGAMDNELAPKVTPGGKVDIVYKVKLNEFNGKVYIDLIVSDLRSSNKI